ncbi:MAG: InlB B-repeat-containing protein [Spirochaetia bacterium]
MGTADVTLYVVWIDSSIRTVLYNGNGNTGGSVPVDGTVYAEGDTVTVLGSGDLVTMQDGISLLFTGWNTAADGSGTDYEESDQFIIGAQNIMLYAQWSVIRATGPAGGLIFYDKGNYDNGWRYLEAAPTDQGAKRWTAGIQYEVGTKGGSLGLGETDTIIITDS